MQQIDVKKSQCLNLNEKGFSYGLASISSSSSPCTNVPMCCPCCPESASLVWKYSMVVHYAKHHSQANFTDAASDFVIGQAECASLNAIWASQHAKKRHRRDPGNRAPLLVSDAHIARVTFV